MWKDIHPIWQATFEHAWRAYTLGNLPIGAVITDAKGEIVSRGANNISVDGGMPVHQHELAHAELNALLRVDPQKYSDSERRSFVLYTSMEPCPLCFGAIIMSKVRSVCYAARDLWAGATGIGEVFPYVMNKKISVQGPVPELEALQIAMHCCRDLERRSRQGDVVFETIASVDWTAAEVGIQWHERGEIRRLMLEDTEAEEALSSLFAQVQKAKEEA